MTETFVALGILVVIILLTLLASYNGLAQLRQQVRAAWGEMDVQLKRRYERLPDLVNLVQSVGGIHISSDFYCDRCETSGGHRVQPPATRRRRGGAQQRDS